VGDIFTSNLRCTDAFRLTYQARFGGAGGPSWQPLPEPASAPRSRDG
jgi:hypothetical protein